MCWYVSSPNPNNMILTLPATEHLELYIRISTFIRNTSVIWSLEPGDTSSITSFIPFLSPIQSVTPQQHDSIHQAWHQVSHNQPLQRTLQVQLPLYASDSAYSSKQLHNDGPTKCAIATCTYMYVCNYTASCIRIVTLPYAYYTASYIYTHCHIAIIIIIIMYKLYSFLYVACITIDYVHGIGNGHSNMYVFQ